MIYEFLSINNDFSSLTNIWKLVSSWSALNFSISNITESKWTITNCTPWTKRLLNLIFFKYDNLREPRSERKPSSKMSQVSSAVLKYPQPLLFGTYETHWFPWRSWDKVRSPLKHWRLYGNVPTTMYLTYWIIKMYDIFQEVIKYNFTYKLFLQQLSHLLHGFHHIGPSVTVPTGSARNRHN